MQNLSETIGQLCNLLEDAVEEQDWEMVTRVSSSLSELYDELDRLEYSY